MTPLRASLAFPSLFDRPALSTATASASCSLLVSGHSYSRLSTSPVRLSSPPLFLSSDSDVVALSHADLNLPCTLPDKGFLTAATNFLFSIASHVVWLFVTWVFQYVKCHPLRGSHQSLPFRVSRLLRLRLLS